MAKRLIPLLLSLTLLQTGCAIHSLRVDQGVLIDKESLSYLQEGLTQDQVRKIIGPPANVSSFQPLRWEYVLQSTEEKFTQNKVHKLVLHFDPQGYLHTWKASE